MELAAHRLLYDNIHDFKTTAALVEAEISRHGIRGDRNTVVPDMKGRRHLETWASLKTVSHFNLATALELMLKLILFRNNTDGPKCHSLTELYAALPAQARRRLESTYQESRSVRPDGYELVAFLNTASPREPERPATRDISTLSGFFEYLDEDVALWKKRYSWELVGRGQFRHYLSDIAVFVEFINRVMRRVPRE